MSTATLIPRTHVLLIALLAGVLLAGVVGPGAAQAPVPDVATHIEPETLEAHIRTLSVDIGARPAGSKAEASAVAYVAAQFESWGYAVTVQEFEIKTADQGRTTSRNVIALREASHADSSELIVVGAHLDSVTAGTGADDNASGLAVLLTVAETLADLDTTRPVAFVAFGAEEIGLKGSTHYVESLTSRQVEDILVMINVDTVGSGDRIYVYAGAITERASCQSVFISGPVWARDMAIDLGGTLGHDLYTTPATSWNGFIGPWSDHYPFAEHGVPVAYFERWNWDVGDDPCWGQETAEGDILHTPRDVFEYVDVAKIEPVAETVALLVARLATGEPF